ncbi:MAG: T9SS type A sorting domain-containing protein [Cyclobacteriaceae bacterium]
MTNATPVDWPTDGGATIGCSEGGFALGKLVLIIPAGKVVNFNNGADTWAGTRIEVFGTLNVTAAVTINSNLIVKNGGLVNVNATLSLGTVTGCGYYIALANGGIVNVGDTGADRLNICGVSIMKGSGGCNTCLGTNSARCAYNGSPYCEPGAFYTGQTAYDQTGYNISLPIKLLHFTADAESEKVKLVWATFMEENFHKFIVERSNDGLTFESIGEVPGKGFNIYDIESQYAFEDEAPLIGYNYYRLKALDLDNSFEYSAVKAVKLNGSKKLAVFPNPSTGEVISFRTNFSPSESDRIVILNQLGVEIFNGHASASQNQISVEGKLRAGMYMLRYVSKDFEQTARIVVKH